jgi:hypothetical protein
MKLVGTTSHERQKSDGAHELVPEWTMASWYGLQWVTTTTTTGGSMARVLQQDF